MIVVERERQPVVGVGVDHGRAEAEAVVEELDERIRAAVGGAAAGVAAAAGDAEQPGLVERRAGQVVQAGVVALHVLHVGEIPGVADHGGREVAAAFDVRVEDAHHRRRVDVQRHRPRGAGALRGDGPRARRQVAVVPVEEAVVGEGERLGDALGIDLDDVARLRVGGAQRDGAAHAAPLQAADRGAVAALGEAHPVEVDGRVRDGVRPARAGPSGPSPGRSMTRRSSAAGHRDRRGRSGRSRRPALPAASCWRAASPAACREPATGRSRCRPCEVFGNQNAAMRSWRSGVPTLRRARNERRR